MLTILKILILKRKLNLTHFEGSEILCFSLNSKNPIVDVNDANSKISCFDFNTSRRFSLGILDFNGLSYLLNLMVTNKGSFAESIKEWRIYGVSLKLSRINPVEIWLDSFAHSNRIIIQAARRCGIPYWEIQHGAFQYDGDWNIDRLSSEGMVCWNRTWQKYFEQLHPGAKSKLCNLSSDYFSKMLNVKDEPEPSKPRYVYITSYLNKNIAEEIYEFLLNVKSDLKVDVFLKPHPSTKELFALSGLPQQYHVYPKEYKNVTYIFDTSTLGYLLHEKGYRIHQFIPKERDASKLLLV